MFSIRKEGRPFKSGLNFQFGGSYSAPYFALYWVTMDFNTDVVRRIGFRFSLWCYTRAISLHTGSTVVAYPIRRYEKVIEEYPAKFRLTRFFPCNLSYNYLENVLKIKNGVLVHQDAYEVFVDLAKDNEQRNRRLTRQAKERAERVKATAPPRKLAERNAFPDWLLK